MKTKSKPRKQPERNKPVAFDVSLNGRQVCVAALRGSLGAISGIVSYIHRADRESVRLLIGGEDFGTNEQFNAAEKRLKIGDEVTFRIVRGALATRELVRMKAPDPVKEDRKLLRYLAKKCGYKLMKT